MCDRTFSLSKILGRAERILSCGLVTLQALEQCKTSIDKLCKIGQREVESKLRWEASRSLPCHKILIDLKIYDTVAGDSEAAEATQRPSQRSILKWPFNT